MANRKVLYARVSRVENFMNMLLTKYKVSKHIFVSNLPVTIRSEWDDMALIDVGKGNDMNAYNSFSANVYLYAKPQGDLQQKNVKTIDAMEEAFGKAMAECNDKHYHPVINWRDADYDTTRNFHFNVINLTITVTE